MSNIGLEKIWNQFESELRAFVMQRVKNPMVADDLLQEVFLRIHARVDSLRDETSLRGWLYQITRNVVTDYFRSHEDTVDVSQLENLPEPTDDDARVKNLTPSIRAFVEALPPDFREALLLTEYDGLTQKEAAEKIGISLTAMKSRVQRAREKLKRMLLDCCRFELSRMGHVISYTPKSGDACKPNSIC
jgi:RNA polymerase sigma-70 factor (ECF subfamily)